MKLSGFIAAHEKLLPSVITLKSAIFFEAVFLLPFLLRVEGLMEQKRLHCSVVRDHLNNKFNLRFTVMSLHSSPSSFFYFVILQLSLKSFLSVLLHFYKIFTLDIYKSLKIYRGSAACDTK